MKKTIHDELVNIIIQNTDKNENPVDLLMDIIPMSKEAAYRRLRGEIKFSLDEAVLISQRLRTSLRNLFEIYADVNRSSFHLYNLDSLSLNDFSQYSEMMKTMLSSFKSLTSSTYKSRIYVASTFIPQAFYLNYSLITKLQLFKWIFQMKKQMPVPKLCDLVVPEEVENTQAEFSSLMEMFDYTFVCVDDLFSPIIKDIRFFHNLGLINNEEILQLKDELHALINKIEKYANTGFNNAGRSISIYVSEISFDASYTYLERSDGYQIFSINILGLNFLGTEEQKICNIEKSWIESLMHYSNFISKSGEFERIKFIKKQRELVNQLAL